MLVFHILEKEKKIWTKLHTCLDLLSYIISGP
jgi:hypothetical protein